MTRPVCPTCKFLDAECICAFVKPVDNQTNIIVLQHKSEQQHAKNTVRLAKLMYNNINVIVGDSAADFEIIDSLPLSTTALLFPSDNAENLDSAKVSKLTHLIILDGTWKKASKLLFMLPTLQSFRKVSFSRIPKNQYRLRKANREDSLSSLEAIAYAIQCIENKSMAPAYTLLNAMMENQFKRMPDHVRARYLEKSGSKSN